MSEALSPSANHSYGRVRVCSVRQVAHSTIHHQRELLTARQAPPPEPVGAGADADLFAEIRDVAEVAPFFSEGYRKVWDRLRLRASGQRPGGSGG